MNLHFISSIVFALLLGLLAINDNLMSRMLLLVPVLSLFYLTMFFFGLEYNKIQEQKWKSKKKKLIEETYLRFFKVKN